MSGVTLSLGNDFIEPGAACTKPIKPKKQEPGQSGPHVLRFEGDEENDGAGKPAVARVTLNDCLACSGCVTSAETVLGAQQGVAEFLRAVGAGEHALVLLSMSAAARAAIAVHCGLGLRETFGRLSGFFKGVGCHAVFDTGLATELTPAHQASLAEFFQAIINWDGANVAKNIIAFSSNLQPSFDSAVFTKDVTTAVRHFQDSTPRAGDCMAAIFETVQRHHVTIDPNVMVAVVTVMVLEGWQFRLDPSINILDYIGDVMRSSFRKHQRLTVMDVGLRDMWAPFSEPNALTMDRSGARPMAWSMQGSGENSGGLWYGEYQSRD